MAEQNFEIKLPQFEGPFDLLLFFIERDELDIHDIAIAKITDDFLEYLHRMNALNIELASDFIVVAATLMRIKAKMLLPRYVADGTGEEVDFKEDLIRKLIDYKKFKQVAEELQDLENERFKQLKRGNIAADLQIVEQIPAQGDELASFDLYKLMLVYERLNSRYTLQEKEVVHTVLQYPYTIEKQKEVIAALLAINKKISFEHISSNSENKVHFVYNFLALLEMLQQRLITIQTGLGYNNFRLESKIGL